MLRKLTLLGAAGAVASAALAMAGPVTAHARVCPGGDQHIGYGHHSFDHSSDNCVLFSGKDQSTDTAYLTDSYNNAVSISGEDNLLELVHSDHNTVSITGSDNSITGIDSYDNTGLISGSHDVITGTGVVDSTFVLTGSWDFLVLDSGCSNMNNTATPFSASHVGSPGHPVTLC